MNSRIAWVIVIGSGLLVPGCSRGGLGGFPGWGVGNATANGDEDDEDGDDEDGDSDGGLSTSGPSFTSGDDPSTDPSGAPPADGGGLPPPGDCCSGHGGMGCEDPMVEACVCAQDSFCCTMKWDDTCAELTSELGCAPCDMPPPGPGETGEASSSTSGEPEVTSGPPPSSDDTTTGAGEDTGSVGFGDCCEADGSAGCDDAAIESCVCAQDSYCCDNDWDGICVDEVDEFGCGTCGGGAGETSGGGESTTTSGGGESSGGDTGVGDCCESHDAGCSAGAIESCVCALDAYCCDTAWDSLCVSEVDDFACGMCP